ncbi:hypothetical protein FO519_008914 [Halicephalobus sp. NKZ332]|nr:hypothetical protein FO519_008914 [Halicephalobus sp. NKZ332]
MDEECESDLVEVSLTEESEAAPGSEETPVQLVSVFCEEIPVSLISDFSEDPEDMTATNLKAAPRGVPLSSTNLGASGGQRGSQSIDGSIYSSGSRRGRSPRQSNQRQHFSIKNSKFWLRILKPWKWKKRSKKSRLARTGSNSSKTNSQGVHSISTGSHLTSPEQYFQAAASLKQTPTTIGERRLDVNSTPQNSISENSNKISSEAGIEICRASTNSIATVNSCQTSLHSLPVNEFSTPVVHRIQLVETDKENHFPSGNSGSTVIGTETPRFPVTRFLPHPPVFSSPESSPTKEGSEKDNSPTVSGITTFPVHSTQFPVKLDRSSVISIAGELGDSVFGLPPMKTEIEIPPRLPSIVKPNSSENNQKTSVFESTQIGTETEMNGVVRRIPIYQEVAASQPDLNAQPRKPVLRRPGQPSRLRNSQLMKKENSDFLKKESSPRKDNLPSRLTDDSDSDSDIKYRSDDSDEDLFVPKPSTASEKTPGLAIGRWGSSVADTEAPRSTNPAIASKIVPRPSMSESHDYTENQEQTLNDDDDDEVAINSAFAAKIQRRDTMARKLDAPDPVDDIPDQTPDERRKIMHRVSLKLERKLSERPLAEELEQRNILKTEQAISKANMDETRKMLLRKLSFRPTIQQLKDKQIIKFNDYVEVTEAEIYDRKGDKPWTRLTPAEKALIRKELNDFKATEMNVHADSRIYTRFHRP